jgi:hypothetical protein
MDIEDIMPNEITHTQKVFHMESKQNKNQEMKSECKFREHGKVVVKLGRWWSKEYMQKSKTEEKL